MEVFSALAEAGETQVGQQEVFLACALIGLKNAFSAKVQRILLALIITNSRRTFLWSVHKSGAGTLVSREGMFFQRSSE